VLIGFGTQYGIPARAGKRLAQYAEISGRLHRKYKLFSIFHHLSLNNSKDSMRTFQKRFRTDSYFYLFGLFLSISNATPPPLCISNIDEWAFASEYSFKEDIVSYGGTIYLRDTVQVGDAGIVMCPSDTATFIKGGRLTSSGSMLNVSIGNSYYVIDRLIIYSPICNNSSGEIGIHITSTSGGLVNAMVLAGSDSNTFTGDSIVEGEYSCLSLGKENGATAIQGDVFLKNGGRLCFWRGDQIADTATITMGRNSVIGLTGIGQEKIHELVVQEDSFIDFTIDDSLPDGNFFYLDDLVVADGASLRMRGWKTGLDFLLVRKDSEHLQDALSKIKFEGQEDKYAGLKDYNSDYWQIGPGFPEPTSYGATFGIMGLGLSVFRRRRLSDSALLKDSHCVDDSL